MSKNPICSREIKAQLDSDPQAAERHDLQPAPRGRPFNTDIVMLLSIPAGSTCFLLHSEQEDDDMPESVYKVIELIGTSNESWEKAAANAVGQAAKSLRDLRVAEVVQLDLQLDAKGQVEAYRAKLNVSFKFEGT
jgi:flavin-binding protein dodecin